MQKPVLIGGGLGLLLLVLVAGSLWVSGNGTAPVATVSAPPVATPRVAPVGDGASSPTVAPASSAQAQLARQERRRRLSEVRAEFNALRAQGAQASPEKMRALVDELEAVSPPGFDPRYFQALRNMLASSAKVQALNTELQGLLKSQAPKDVARQEAILAEMRALGLQVSKEAQDLQTYAPAPVPQAKSP